MIAALDPVVLDGELAGTRFASRGQVHATVRCTNDTLQELARTGACEGTFVIAGEQEAGRGRRGRRWESGAGLGLYLSVLFRPQQGLPIYWTLGAAVAACDACREFGVGATTIKWPNDLLVTGRKLAGILVDTRTAGNTIRDLVVGLGINVNHDEEQLRSLGVPGVTSLRVEAGLNPHDGRLAVACAFLRRLEDIARLLEAGDWARVAEEWLERSPQAQDASVIVHPHDGAPWPGVSAGLAPDGALRVRDVDGRVHLVHQVDSVRFEETA